MDNAIYKINITIKRRGWKHINELPRQNIQYAIVGGS